MADTALFGVEWKIDNGKSIFSSNFSPNFETRFYEQLENGYKLTVKGSKAGKSYEWGYTAYYDGKDHPVYGREDVDAIEPYKVNDHVTIGFFKKAGVYGGPYARKLDTSGNSLTVQTVGKNPDGSVFFDVITYNK
ncbi:MAG: hypothetical protein CFE31_00470 [Rhizobiales bacterium PAR1]|nr:MAG: hypothetical protein CFE31_00470 [Rhizobiales bacterium PAR1]